MYPSMPHRIEHHRHWLQWRKLRLGWRSCSQSELKVSDLSLASPMWFSTLKLLPRKITIVGVSLYWPAFRNSLLESSRVDSYSWHDLCFDWTWEFEVKFLLKTLHARCPTRKTWTLECLDTRSIWLSKQWPHWLIGWSKFVTTHCFKPTRSFVHFFVLFDPYGINAKVLSSTKIIVWAKIKGFESFSLLSRGYVYDVSLARHIRFPENKLK